MGRHGIQGNSCWHSTTPLLANKPLLFFVIVSCSSFHEACLQGNIIRDRAALLFNRHIRFTKSEGEGNGKRKPGPLTTRWPKQLARPGDGREKGWLFNCFIRSVLVSHDHDVRGDGAASNLISRY
ncbi:hypothetical protein KQX54_002753 [Cotesia glomerata]|uniref:Secreted protein n=1 Tax=Cotesia glomerata TaxID=32391 RepID=A0AAV7I4S4_COTGL|nr:hypothetical protein KQX54_002753 [Cotesia glomerata]